MRVPYNWLKEYIDTKLTPKEIAQVLTLAGHALDKPIETTGDSRSRSAPAGQTPGVEFVLDFEDRGNRADVVGLVGLARDLGALTETKLKYPKLAQIPSVGNGAFQPKITVKSDKVLRWRAVVFKNVKIAPSPEPMQKRLKAYGLEPVNNVVDITNYVMVELGMPLHAFDLDQIDEIILRPAKNGERLITFEGAELIFDENDLVAADSKKPLTLTTAIGGRESGISASTQNVLLEAGLYDQPTARKSALRLKVRNETANRLGKYLHPQFCDEAVARTIYLMKEIAKVDPEPTSFDYYPSPVQPVIVELTQARLNLVAGEEIPLAEATRLLTKLEFTAQPKSKKEDFFPKRNLPVQVPYFRTDVAAEDDLIEEVLRLRGYDKIPSLMPAHPAPAPLSFPERELEGRLRDLAVKLGYNEVISQPIIDIRDSQKVGFVSPDPGSPDSRSRVAPAADSGSQARSKIVHLENSWNQELNILRPEMLSGQLKYFLSYLKKKSSWQEDLFVKIFEVGKTYTQDPSKSGHDKYRETRKLVLTTSGEYLSLKADVEALLRELRIKNYEFKSLDFPIFKKSIGADLRVGNGEMAKLGEVRQSVLTAFGINIPVCHAIFYVDRLTKIAPPEPRPAVSTDIINYISEDYTSTLPAEQEVGSFISGLKSQLDPTTKITFKGVFQDEKMKKEGRKSVTVNVKYSPPSYRHNLAKVKKTLSRNLI